MTIEMVRSTCQVPKRLSPRAMAASCRRDTVTLTAIPFRSPGPGSSAAAASAAAAVAAVAAAR